MPLSVGSTRTQSRAGSSGSGTSPRWSIDSALVATSGRPPDAFTIAKDAIDLLKVSASTGALSGAARHLPPQRGGDLTPSPSHRFFVLGGPRVRHGKAPVSRRHAPALDAPPALARDLRQACVRIHRDRSAHELEHPEV